MMNSWKLVPVKPGVNSLPNLYVLGDDVGLVQKPRDSASGKPLWRAYIGVGMASAFLGHAGTKASAMALVESAAAQNVRITTDKVSA